MHSSIAKAQVKGTFRVANDVLDKYNAEAEKRVGQNKPFSRKSMTAYVQNIFDMYGDLLLFHRIDKQNSSWHFDSLNLAINPDPADFGELGILHCIICERVVTRNIRVKRQPYHHYSSICYVHEHFLQRVHQRASPLQTQNIKNMLMSMVLWLDKHHRASDRQAAKLFFVSGKHVVIATYHAKLDVYVFNTVLSKEMFSFKQQQDFQQAYVLLNQSENDFVCINEAGELIDAFKARNELSPDEILSNTTFFNLD